MTHGSMYLVASLALPQRCGGNKKTELAATRDRGAELESSLHAELQRAAAFKSATEEGRDSRGVLTEHLKEAAEHIAHLKV